MDDSLYREIAELPAMTVVQLQRRYLQLYGECNRTKHKQHLIRRIAFRLQVLAQGDISERVRQRARALANDADLRMQVPAGGMTPLPRRRGGAEGAIAAFPPWAPPCGAGTATAPSWSKCCRMASNTKAGITGP